MNRRENQYYVHPGFYVELPEMHSAHRIPEETNIQEPKSVLIAFMYVVNPGETMTTFSMLNKQQKLTIVGQITELIAMDQKALSIIERMKKPYLWQIKELEAFLKNQRTLEQLHDIILKHKTIIEEKTGL